MQGNAYSPVTDFTFWASIGSKDKQKMKLFFELLERTCSHSLVVKHRFGNITIYKGFPQNEDFKFVPFSDKSQAGKENNKQKIGLEETIRPNVPY